MNSTTLQALFLAFREQCIWLRSCYNTYLSLYESDERTTKALNDSAHLFFQDLNRILIEYVLLQVCKITDPAETAGHKNLTFEGLNAELCNDGLMTQEIADLSAGLSHYRDLVKDARNKLLGHLDRETILNDLPIGEHAEQEVTEFFSCLQGYVDAVGNAVGVGPLDFRATPGSGDVLDLIWVLKGNTC